MQSWQPFKTIYSSVKDEDFNFLFAVQFSDYSIKYLDLETLLEWENGASADYGNRIIISWKKTRRKLKHNKKK